MKRIALAIVIVAAIVVPNFVFAQVATGIWPSGYWGPLVSCQGNPVIVNSGSGTTPTPNPNACTSLCNLIGTFVNILYFAISICFFILAPLFFAIGGIMVMVAGANPEMLSQGKSVLKAAAIGLAIVLCSYLIVYTFIGIFNASVNGQPLFGTTINCSAQ